MIPAERPTGSAAGSHARSHPRDRLRSTRPRTTPSVSRTPTDGHSSPTGERASPPAAGSSTAPGSLYFSRSARTCVGLAPGMPGARSSVGGDAGLHRSQDQRSDPLPRSAWWERTASRSGWSTPVRRCAKLEISIWISSRWRRRPVLPSVHHGLREVQVRSRRPSEGSPQEAVAERPQGDQVPPQDRPRLRHEEGSRRAVPQGRQQGQGHDPGSRDGPHRARSQGPRPPRGRPGRRSWSSPSRSRRDAT